MKTPKVETVQFVQNQQAGFPFSGKSSFSFLLSIILKIKCIRHYAI